MAIPTLLMILYEIICNTIITSKKPYFSPAYSVHLYTAVKGLNVCSFMINSIGLKRVNDQCDISCLMPMMAVKILLKTF